MTRMACPLRSTDVTPLHRYYGAVHPYPAYNHRMETAIEPAEKGIYVPVLRPNGRDTIPAIQLLCKDLGADLGQLFQRLLVAFPLRQQVYRRIVSGHRVSDPHCFCPLGAAIPGMAVLA
jgi:hypothetical protein